ncbi:hypothetical protein SDA24_11775 [Legionella pneumophila serogroup 8]
MIEGMIGIAISIISVVIPIVWPAIPTWVGVLGLILGAFLIGILCAGQKTIISGRG